MHNFAAKCLTPAFSLSVLQAGYNMSVFSFYLVCWMTLKCAAKNYLMACQMFMAWMNKKIFDSLTTKPRKIKDPDQEKLKREVLPPNAQLQMNICLHNLKLTIVVSYAVTIQMHISALTYLHSITTYICYLLIYNIHRL